MFNFGSKKWESSEAGNGPVFYGLEYPHLTTMGNLSTYALQWSTPEKITQMTENLIRDEIDIISPACGLSTSTSTDRIRAMTATVKASREGMA